MKHLDLGSILALVGLLAPFSAAQNLTSLGPIGGSVSEIVIDPADPDRVLVQQFGVGTFLSTDGGASFDQLTTVLSNTADDFQLDPTNGQVVYALDGNSIFRSPDFGTSWSALPFASAEPLKNLALSNTGVALLAVDAFNVYRSIDSGANWSTVASVVPFAGVVLDDASFAPSNAQRAYYSSNDGIFASTNGGLTWFSPGPYDEWVQALTVSPTDPDTVFVGTPFNGIARSTDGGASFVDITTAPVSGNGEFFTWDAPAGRLWYAQLQGLAYSTDNGNNWTEATDGLFPGLMPIPLAMAIDPNGRRLLGTESNFLGGFVGGGLYAMDAGDTVWDHIGFLAGRILASAIAGPGGRRVVGLAAGVYAALPGQQLLPTAWSSTTNTIAIDPDNANRWLSGGVGSFGDNAQVISMTANGNNPVIRYERFGAGSVQDIEYDPFDNDHVVAGIFPAAFGNEAIIVSNNSGTSWTEIAGTAGWATRDVAFDPHTSGRVLQVSDNNQWAQSLDGGNSWSALQPAWPGTFRAVFLEFDPLVPGRLFRGDEGQGLWRSSDNGGTWTLLDVPLERNSDVEFDVQTVGVLWVTDATGKLLVSADAGSTFTTVVDIPFGKNGSKIARDTDGSMLVGTDGASAWELDSSTPAIVYCTAKTSSAGCTASISTTAPGDLPVSGAGGYGVLASGVQNNKTGLLFAGITGTAAIPFSGGTLCMLPPLKRGPLMPSLGSAPPTNDCTGSYLTIVNDGSIIPDGLDAGPGVTATYQYWYRDPAGGVGNAGTALSNAVLLTFE